MEAVGQFLSDQITLNVIINALMLFVWALYFQLLLNAQWRQKRAKILINRSAGRSINSNCIVTNMSPEPIYINAVVIEMGNESDRLVCSLTDLEDAIKAPEANPMTHWFQGPLTQGEYINLGAYRELLERAVSASSPHGRKLDLPNTFQISVIANHGPDELLVAASRQFRWDQREGKDRLAAGETYQIRSRRERRRLENLTTDHDFRDLEGG